jgi:hypothetical protein
MKKITKKVLLEEIEEIVRINELIRFDTKTNVNEQVISFFEKLFRGGEEGISDVVKTIERSGIKGADDVASAFRSLAEKGLKSLNQEESLFLSNVIRQVFPDITSQVRRDLSSLMTPYLGQVGVGKLEGILANERFTTEQIYRRLTTDFGMENLSTLELQVWRDALKGKPTNVKIPTTVEVGPKPENIRQTTELPPLVIREIETAVDNEVSRLPEGGALGNPEIPFVTNLSDPAATEFINKKMAENGMNTNEVSPKDLLNLMEKMMESNKSFAEANKSTADAIIAGIERNKTNPPVKPTNIPTPKVNPTLLERVKKLWNADKTSIDAANWSMTALQVASICIDVYGTDKKFSEYSNPFYGKNLGFWEIMGIKLLARGLHGKALLAVNAVLTVVDLVGMGYDLATYHPERMKKLSDAEKKAKENQRLKDSTDNANRVNLQKLKDLDLRRTADSLRQKYSEDSLIKAVRDKLNPKNKLDSAGKEQIVDPFKQ